MINVNDIGYLKHVVAGSVEEVHQGGPSGHGSSSWQPRADDDEACEIGLAHLEIHVFLRDVSHVGKCKKIFWKECSQCHSIATPGDTVSQIKTHHNIH